MRKQTGSEHMQTTDRRWPRLLSVSMLLGIGSAWLFLSLDRVWSDVNSFSMFLVALAGLFGAFAGIVVGVVYVFVEQHPKTFVRLWGGKGTVAATLAWLLLNVFVARQLAQSISALLLSKNLAQILAPIFAWLLALLPILVLQRGIRIRWPKAGMRLGGFVGANTLFAIWSYFTIIYILVPLRSAGPLLLCVCLVIATWMSVPGVVVFLLRKAFAIVVPVVFAALAVTVTTSILSPREELAVASAPCASALAGVWTRVSDVDGDGFARDDCAPWDGTIGPHATEIVGNGIDEDCSGSDLKVVANQINDIKPSNHITNLFLVSIDTLRADVLRQQIGKRVITPNLNAFAAQSVEYTRAYSPSTYTNEVMPSVMSSEMPQRWHEDLIYFGQEPTLAQILANKGFQTLAVIQYPWLHDGAILGFDDVDNELGYIKEHGSEGGEELLRRMLEKLDGVDRTRPVFGWLHIFEPHGPNTGRLDPDFSNDTRGRYFQDVAAADHVFGAFIEGLSQRNLLGSSTIIVMSDHGESLGEHNMATHMWAAWDSVVHVPLLIHAPWQPPMVVETPVSTLDILPTVCEGFGFSYDGPRDGVVLPPFGEARSTDIFVVANSDEGRPLTRVIIRENYKLIWYLPTESWMLFDIANDPSELKPLDEPARMAELRTALLEMWSRTQNDVLIKRKAELWPTRELFYPRKMVGDVGGMLRLKKR